MKLSINCCPRARHQNKGTQHLCPLKALSQVLFNRSSGQRGGSKPKETWCSWQLVESTSLGVSWNILPSSPPKFRYLCNQVCRRALWLGCVIPADVSVRDCFCLVGLFIFPCCGVALVSQKEVSVHVSVQASDREACLLHPGRAKSSGCEREALAWVYDLRREAAMS